MTLYNGPENTIEFFNELVEKGDIVLCPGCNQYNAYCYLDSNMDVNTGLRIKAEDGFMDGNEAYTDDELLTNWPDVYQIDTSSCYEWECGNCKTHWMEKDSPLNCEVYTHIPV